MDGGTKDPLTFLTLIVFVIFALLTAVQVLKAAPGALKKRPPTEDFPRRLPSVLLTLLGVCPLIAFYILAGLTEFQSWSGSILPLNDTVLSAMAAFVNSLSHAFLYAALFLVLDYRDAEQALQYEGVRGRRFTVLRVSAVGLVGAMFVVGVVRAGIGATARFAPLYCGSPPHFSIYFLIFYILATAAICGTAIILWKNRRPAESSLQLLWFDKYTLRPIVRVIFPIITLRALYELTFYIITHAPSLSSKINCTALRFADVFIMGISYAMVVSALLGLGLQPKENNKKQGQEREEQEQEGQEDPLVDEGSGDA